MADATIKIRGGAGNAVQIQSRDIDATAPSDTEVLAWNATDAEWEPTSAGAGVTSEWNDTGTVLHPTDSSGTLDNVVIGGTSLANSDIALGVDGAAVFNEQSASVDFRVESNGNDSMLFVDGSADRLGVGTKFPTNFFSASPVQYATGTASQSGTTVTGVGTTWTDAMVGSEFIYADGTNSGAITARGSNTSITVTTGGTVGSQAYQIHYQGLHIESTGHVGVGTTGSDPDSLLHVWAPDEATASIHIETGGDSAADPRIWFHVAGQTNYGVGIDNDDSDSFKITQGSAGALGGNPRVVVQKDTGNVGLGGVTAPGEMLDVDGTLALKEQASAPSGVADYAKLAALEYGNDTYTKLLCHMDGSNDGTSFSDVSAGANGGASNHTVTATGAVTKTATYKFGTASAYFAGDDDYLEIPADADFNVGTGNWTFECWVNTSGNGELFSMGHPDFRILLESGKLKFVGGDQDSYLGNSTTFNDGAWHHVVVVRQGTNITGYKDGVALPNYMTTSSSMGSSSNVVRIGIRGDELTNDLTGYIDEVRFDVGVARYPPYSWWGDSTSGALATGFDPQGAAWPVSDIFAVDSGGNSRRLSQFWEEVVG